MASPKNSILEWQTQRGDINKNKWRAPQPPTTKPLDARVSIYYGMVTFHTDNIISITATDQLFHQHA